MSRVWLLMVDDFDDYTRYVWGIYATKELAEQAKIELTAKKSRSRLLYDIEEWEINNG